MRFDEWEPVYEEILRDFGWSRYDDESSRRIIEAVTLNNDLIDDDDLFTIFKGVCTVFGNGPNLEDDVRSCPLEGALVASGSAVGRLLALDVVPDLMVTDLDGDIEPQIELSSRGVPTVIHAHGDNQDLLRMYASRFRGPVILSTQAEPTRIIFNFGGFTDGDRAVCIARSAGSRDIRLLGFDYDHPTPKADTDPDMKLRKLQWARRIIHDMNPPGVLLRYPSDL